MMWHSKSDTHPEKRGPLSLTANILDVHHHNYLVLGLLTTSAVLFFRPSTLLILSTIIYLIF